jgi:DNA repair protein RadC
MKLFVRDETGEYLPATTLTILKESRSRTQSALRKGVSITSSETAKDAIAVKFLNYPEREVFGCLFLDAQHRVIEWKELFFGTINVNTVYPREVVKAALQLNAASIVFAHNHPSGSIKPSQQDIALTKTLAEILKVIDVRVLDHLIIGDSVYSLADNGLMPTH